MGIGLGRASRFHLRPFSHKRVSASTIILRSSIISIFVRNLLIYADAEMSSADGAGRLGSVLIAEIRPLALGFASANDGSDQFQAGRIASARRRRCIEGVAAVVKRNH